MFSVNGLRSDTDRILPLCFTLKAYFATLTDVVEDQKIVILPKNSNSEQFGK
jgi:hypothetical protein